MTDSYRFRLITLDDVELGRTSELLRLVFPGSKHLTPRYLRWKYANNPDGIAIGCNAYDGEQLVGTMAAVPMRGRLEGEERSGLFMLNGAVHPNHRGMKLQSRISAAIFEESVNRGFDFCFGTGNKYSTGPLLTRFKLLKQLEARLGMGLPVLKCVGGASSFDRSWSQAAMGWRLQNPEATYRVGAVRQRSMVTAPTAVPGLDAILYDGAAQWPLTDHRPSPLRPHLWIGLHHDIDWSRSAYVSIPRRLRASPLNLVFKDLTGGSYLPDPERISFRAIDFDAF